MLKSVAESMPIANARATRKASKSGIQSEAATELLPAKRTGCPSLTKANKCQLPLDPTKTCILRFSELEESRVASNIVIIKMAFTAG